MATNDVLEALENKRRMLWRFITRAEYFPDLLDMLYSDLSKVEAKITMENLSE